MFKFKNTGRPLKTKLITAAALGLLIIIMLLLRQFPDVVERYYAGGIYPVICFIAHPVLNLIPFSLGDVLYLLAVIYLFYALYKTLGLLFTRQLRALGTFWLQLCIIFEFAYLVFYMGWGLNYFRPTAAERLSLSDTTYTMANVSDVTRMLIDSANMARVVLDSTDRHQLNKKSYQSAVEAVKALGRRSPHFTSYWPGVKPSLLSGLMNYMGTSGYYNPFTSEAQINYQMPAVDIPFVACHEMAHQIGFAREDEANFVGFIAGIGSANRLLKYSAYYAGVAEFMRFLRHRDSIAHHTLRRAISPLIINDFKADSAYWSKFEGRTEMISGLFYDRFLKANNQPQGLHTYNRMIRLTMAYYRKQGRVN